MRLSEAVIQASLWPDARSLFQAAKRAAEAITSIDRQLMFGFEGIERRPGTGARPVISDPTASAAMFAVTAAQELDDMVARRETMVLIVGAALAVIEGVRAGYGDEYADALDYLYIGRLTWADTAERLGVSKSTLALRVNKAFDWVDGVGWRNAIVGRGIAES